MAETPPSKRSARPRRRKISKLVVVAIGPRIRGFWRRPRRTRLDRFRRNRGRGDRHLRSTSYRTSDMCTPGISSKIRRPPPPRCSTDRNSSCSDCVPPGRVACSGLRSPTDRCSAAHASAAEHRPERDPTPPDGNATSGPRWSAAAPASRWTARAERVLKKLTSPSTLPVCERLRRGWST